MLTEEQVKIGVEQLKQHEARLKELQRVAANTYCCRRYNVPGQPEGLLPPPQVYQLA